MSENLRGGGIFWLTLYYVKTDRGTTDLEALPRQWATVEVHKNIAKWLHIVSSALFNTEMCVDTRVPSRARQILVFTVRYMLPCTIITIFLCQAIVDEKNLDIADTCTNTPKNVYIYFYDWCSYNSAAEPQADRYN